MMMIMSIVVIIINMFFLFNASKAIVNHPQFYQFYGWYSINHQSTWVVYGPVYTASTTRSMGMVDKKIHQEVGLHVVPWPKVPAGILKMMAVNSAGFYREFIWGYMI